MVYVNLYSAIITKVSNALNGMAHTTGGQQRINTHLLVNKPYKKYEVAYVLQQASQNQIIGPIARLSSAQEIQINPFEFSTSKVSPQDQ